MESDLSKALLANSAACTQLKGLKYVLDTANGGPVPVGMLTQSLINIVTELYVTNNALLKYIKDEHERSQQS